VQRKRFLYLQKRFLNNLISEEELQEYLSLLEDHEDQFAEELRNTEDLHKSEFDHDTAFKRLTSTDHFASKGKRIVRYQWLAVACSLFLVFSFGLFWFNREEAPKQTAEDFVSSPQSAEHANQLSSAIQLADGTQLAITDISQQPTNYQGVRLSSPQQGLIQVELRETHLPISSAFHEFKAEKGTSYSLLLPDGSTVHLNSGSTLKLAAGFHVENRKCVLSGEGFFEVAKHEDWPFEVETRDYTIAVLGTQFNVKSYPQMDRSTTALLEGSVQLTSPHTRLTLEPGQQVQASGGESWKKTKANFREILAWRDGYFRFSNASLQDIMEDVLTWYAIDGVEYEHQIDERFTGSIVRSRSLSEVLRSIEKIANLKFEIKERRIFVRK